MGNALDRIQKFEDELETLTDRLEFAEKATQLVHLMEQEFGKQARSRGIELAKKAAESFLVMNQPTGALSHLVWLREVGRDEDGASRLERQIAHAICNKKAMSPDQHLPVPTPYQKIQAKIVLEDFGEEEFKREQIRFGESGPFLFLSKLNIQECVRVLKCAESLDLKKKKYLFKEGSDAEAFYVLVEGDLELTSSSGLKRKVSPGEFLGDLALFGQMQHSASARAISECRLVKFSAKRLEICFDTIPRLAQVVLEAFYKRLFKNVSKHSLIFHLFDDGDIESMWEFFIPINVAKGKVLMEPSRLSDRFFLVVKGEVKIERPDQKPVIIGPGHFVGERGVILNRARIATVTTMSKCQLLECDSLSFLEMCETFPKIRQWVEANRDSIEAHKFSAKSFVID